MIRHQFNFAALSDLPIEQKRSGVFNAVKGALSLLPIALDVIGQQSALKLAANDPNLIKGAPAAMPSEQAISAFLISDRASKHFSGTKWAVGADTPAVIATANRVIQFARDNIGEIDLGYTGLFRFVDMRNSQSDSIDVVNTSSAIRFEQNEYGGQIKINRNISASATTLKMMTFSGGVAILDDWLRFNKWYNVQQAVEDLQLSYARDQMDLHYGMLTAVSAGNNVAFTVDDATTFNKAVAGMLRKLDAKKYVLGANVQVDIVVSPENIGRVLAMLEARKGSPMVAYGTQKQPIAFGVRNVIMTTKIAAAENAYYAVLPERKLVRAVWADLTIETARAADYRATDWYAHGQFNSNLGDQDQVARVLLQ